MIGWILDIYSSEDRTILWVIDKQGNRAPLSLVCPITFYASGPSYILKRFQNNISKQTDCIKTDFICRRDVFFPKPIEVLSITAKGPQSAQELYKWATNNFPGLKYYDAEIPVSLRLNALYGVFPLCLCDFNVSINNEIISIQTLDSAWALEHDSPDIRILEIVPNRDPHRFSPNSLSVNWKKSQLVLSLDEPKLILIQLSSILRQFDPDILRIFWGDFWLLPYLRDISETFNIPIELNRDVTMHERVKRERTYHSYGRVVHRDQQVHLFGRLHIDPMNAMLFHEYGMEGVFELGRVTGLPIQTVARVSPGSGVSAMETTTALRQGILVPCYQQQAEMHKSGLDLIRADQGGLVYQPIIGIHSNVFEIDFSSMYPSIMVRHNISPETILKNGEFDASQPPGLIPQAIKPLLEKRLALKKLLADLPGYDPRKKLYKAWSSAHKGILVTCFGYLGYKNSVFGRGEAHEAVTKLGREAVLKAKQIVEDNGYTVLHIYVDGLWIRQGASAEVKDIQSVLKKITSETGLQICLDGILDWIVFLPSQNNPRIPVSNRFFGVFHNGEIKLRGIEARRRDTPRWIVNSQETIIKLLATERDPDYLKDKLPDVITYLRAEVNRLKSNKIPFDDLAITNKMSRHREEYRVCTAAVRASIQKDTKLKPGEYVRFIFTSGSPDVIPVEKVTSDTKIDFNRYIELLFRAGQSVLLPLGIDIKYLYNHIIYRSEQLAILD